MNNPVFCLENSLLLNWTYPIRGYKQPIKATTETPDSPLPVETGLSVDMESSQVEMTDLPKQVEMTDSASHVETDSPIKGTLVTHSFELKKYKRPRRFKCKICGESATSVKVCGSYVIDVAWDYHLKVVSPSTKSLTKLMLA